MYRAITAYVIVYGAIAAWAPYLSAYYKNSLGLPLGVVGLLMASTSAVGLVASPVWGTLHDRNPRSRFLLPLAGAIAATGAFGLFFVGPSPLLPLAAMTFALGGSGLAPMMDVRVLEMVGADRTRYAQVRVWGSISFIILAPLIGILTVEYGLPSLFWVMVPALALGGLAATTLPGRHAVVSTSMLRAPMVVLRHRPIALLLLGSFFAWAAISSQNIFFTIYLQQLGGSTQLAGNAWSIAALLEVPTMFLFPVLARRFKVERLIVFGSLLLVSRMAGNVFFTDPDILMGLSLIQGAGYSMLLIGSITFVSREAPRGTAATAQGIWNATAGSLAAIVGSGVGGQIAGLVTIRGLYVVCAVTTLLATIMIAAAVFRPRGDRAESPGLASTADSGPAAPFDPDAPLEAAD